MKQKKVIVSMMINLLVFGLLLTLIVLGQKNAEPVIWLANVLGTKNIRGVGVGLQICAVFGFLGQLSAYNHQYQA